MANPQISFRLTNYQLARGLKIIQAIEPNTEITSLSQLVKTLYLDYIAKTSLSKESAVTEKDLNTVSSLISTKKKSMDFNAFQTITKRSTKASKSSDSIESKVSSVSDFSPPKDWTE